jgi:hypothetical protein
MLTEGGKSMDETRSIDMERAESPQDSQKCFQEYVRALLGMGAMISEEYEEIIVDCAEQDISERDLWKMMALYREKGVIKEQGGYPIKFTDWYGQKLRKRVLGLIGKLPLESLGEFRELVAFTASFMTRAEFVCDLLVYLFAEREKGWEREETDKSEYVKFFTEKLMWELNVINQVVEDTSLEGVNRGYVDWLTDRILDGEVMA